MQRRVSLGRGDYRARRAGGKVVLDASGTTPTPNYKVWLRRAADAEAADYELWWMAPADRSIELSTPFSAHVSFGAESGAGQVRVRDATGVHVVAVEGGAEGEVEPSAALVYLHCANQFDLEYRGKEISFTQANIAGDPLLNYGDRYFYGEQIELQESVLGELVTVTLEQRPSGERWRLTLALPRTWVSGYEAAPAEVLVVETLAHGVGAGPPPGQEIEYERTTEVLGRASFVVS